MTNTHSDPHTVPLDLGTMPDGTPATIEMPQAHLDSWLAALDSGEYPQGCGRLAELADDGDGDFCGFCCLGVLQVAIVGGVEAWCEGEPGGETVIVDPRQKNPGNADVLGLPSEEWLAQHGIRFLNYEKGADGTLTERVMGRTPWLPAFEMTAALANDTGGKTFPEIADAIRACARGTTEPTPKEGT